jgi:hypothetical protein
MSMLANRVKVRLIPGCSDGDPLHVPPPGGAHTQVDPPTLYLEKIGQQWMESRGEAKPGVHYSLQDLPFGYTLWHRPRPSNPNHFDRYLYGHPAKKAFDSPNRFFPHFLHLMQNNGNNIGCPCTLCSGSAGVLPKSWSNSSPSVVSSRKSSNSSAPLQSRPSSSHSIQQPVAPLPSLTLQPKGRPKKIAPGLDTTNVDDEGTPDVYRNLIDKLRRHRDIDEAILEPLSPDWRAEQEHLPKFLDDIKTQKQWVPRTGDIVLYVRNMSDTVILIQDETDELQLYDERSKQHLGAPQWAAGLVTEPAIGTTVAEMVVRIEPIPNPNDSDKSVSKRHKYVLLRQTCPFIMWRDLLRRIPQEEWHYTVKNALALMSTLSLVGKYRFRGSWPNASIYCHGIYVGAEMLAVGDTVRLLPNKQQSGCTDVMSIKSIRLKWTNLDKASNNDYDEGRPYNSEIWIYGAAYTTDGSRSNKLWVTEHNVQPPPVADDYANVPWYPLHPADKELAIPYSRVLGRLHERDAVPYFLKPDHAPPGLDLGRQAVTEARAFARKHDNRIAQEPDATWYWGDDRADALNLHTINGLDVSRYDLDRDVKDLRRKYRQLDGIANGEARPTGQERLGSKGLRRFMAPDLPLRVSSSEAASHSGRNESPTSRKRSHIVDLENDDDDTEEEGIDEEIRESTKVVVEHRQGAEKKKAKVMVVIK